MSFISLSCLIALARTSGKMLNANVVVTCLVTDLEEGSMLSFSTKHDVSCRIFFWKLFF